VGQSVSVGQKIADPANAHSVVVHASISGIVTKLGHTNGISGTELPMIEITPDKTENFLSEIGRERKGWQDLSRESLLEIFRLCGLVEMTPDMEALHDKTRAGARLLILNACELEPYVIADYALIMSHPLEVLKGVELLKKVCGAESVVIAASQDKMEAAELLKSKIYFLKWKNYSVEIFPALYPQDIDCLLEHEFLNKKISGIPSAIIPSEIRTFSPATAFAAYEAVAMQKPLYERAVTIGGECVFEPKTVWIRMGTSLADAFSACKGFMRQPNKIVVGGPMRGRVSFSREAPILKGFNAVLALPDEVVRREVEKPCIRCGRCIEVCPVEISPVMISLAVEHQFLDMADSYGAGRCVECGNCTYICPSKRPMASLMCKALTHIASAPPKKTSEKSLFRR
jgi:electron transport complex protein RnfC